MRSARAAGRPGRRRWRAEVTMDTPKLPVVDWGRVESRADPQGGPWLVRGCSAAAPPPSDHTRRRRWRAPLRSIRSHREIQSGVGSISAHVTACCRTRPGLRFCHPHLPSLVAVRAPVPRDPILRDTGWTPWRLVGFALMRGATTGALSRPPNTWGDGSIAPYDLTRLHADTTLDI
jgi:hypothetical protein